MQTFKFLKGNPVDERPIRMLFYEQLVRGMIKRNAPSMHAISNQVQWFMEDGLEKFIKINNISEWGVNRDVINIFYAVHTHNYNNHIPFVEYRAVMTSELYNELCNETLRNATI